MSAADNWYDEPIVVSEYLKAHEAAKAGYFSIVCRKLLTHLGTRSSYNILDVGSGLGTFADYVRSTGEVRFTVIGVEPSKYAVEFAESKGLTTVHGELKEGVYPYKKNFYDVCLLFNILEHVQYPEQILQLAVDTVGDKGIIVIRVPNIGFHRLLSTFKAPNLNPKGHPTNFSYLGLRIITQNMHLEIVEVLFELGTNTIEREGLVNKPLKKFIYILTKRLIMSLSFVIFFLTFRTVNPAPSMLIFAKKIP
jgi:2-polyprenyl-3-methyl-5-hydroxy-6-metoxy-1,4-benzoquinol methylase